MVPLREIHVVAFGVAALCCLVSISQVGRFEDRETRTGLTALLLCSGVWAAAHTLRLSAPGDGLKTGFYMVGLIVGFASVGAWLYFCSAYSGHEYHRRPVVRQTALVLYLVVVGVKLTNPVHELYFVTTFATEPFPHLAIDPSPVHWVVTGLAYALTAVGFYLLYETFSESSLDTRLLGLLVATTAVPVVFDIFAYTGLGPFIKFNYEPLGVAVFAVGALYVADEQFVAVPQFWRNRVLETLDDAVLLISDDRVVRDVNAAAVSTFPALEGALGDPLFDVLPAFAEVLDSDDDIVAMEDGVQTRYFLIESAPVASGARSVGEVLICTDVTEVERQRRELSRQNEQFDDFAAAITHELRNTLSIAQGYLELASQGVSADTRMDVQEATETARRSLDRMDRIVADLSTLARYGQTLESKEFVDPGDAASDARDRTDTDDLDVSITGDRTVAADRSRLVELFANCFEFAVATESSQTAIDVGTESVTVVANGDSIPPDQAEKAFEYGEAVPNAETGIFLPTIRTLCRVHGWTVELDSPYPDGVRLVIRDVRTRPADEP